MMLENLRHLVGPLIDWVANLSLETLIWLAAQKEQFLFPIRTLGKIC